MKTPCPQDCPKRNDHCHAVCSTYLAVYRENVKRYNAKQTDYAIGDVISTGIRARMQKMHRKQAQR